MYRLKASFISFQIELIIMDEDFGFDNTIGRETVELDDLPLDEEKYMEIQFEKVSTSSLPLKSTKVTKHTRELFYYKIIGVFSI